MTGIHAGDSGDCLYGLIACRLLGATTLVLHADNGKTHFTSQRAEMLAELLRKQTYLTTVEVATGPETPKHDYDLSKFRDHPNHPSIVECHLAAFGLLGKWKYEPWLTVEPEPCDIVFARSFQYRNPRAGWKSITDEYRDRAIFVGLPAEHADFEQNFGPVQFRQTTILEMARLIAGCRLFIGNSSLPMAIADALGVPSWLEFGVNTRLARPNVVVLRNGWNP